MAVVLGVAKQILSDDLDDIETWQSQNLARDLAWGSWNPAAEDEYAKSIIGVDRQGYYQSKHNKDHFRQVYF